MINSGQQLLNTPSLDGLKYVDLSNTIVSKGVFDSQGEGIGCVANMGLNNQGNQGHKLGHQKSAKKSRGKSFHDLGTFVRTALRIARTRCLDSVRRTPGRQLF